ncbi:hypothetical protein ZWY2020_008388 [Hordeum vulgare]|nr:hypothetical protein ZWY2020_008388 [Hordeum vulgare]
MSDQPQPVRTGDVYPPSASAHDARRQRDEVLGTHGGDQQQNQDGDLRSPRPLNHTGRRVVTATGPASDDEVHGSRFTVVTHYGQFTACVGRAWRRRRRGDHRRLPKRRQTPGGQASGLADAGRGAVCRDAPRARRCHPRKAAKRQQVMETNMRPASWRRTGSVDGRVGQRQEL